METKANTTLIGAFTLIVLALGFVFIYWLARGSEQSSAVPLRIVFEDPVTGLTVGSQVLFNGLNVGRVKSLTLDPKNPKAVIAHLSVQPLESIKADTRVTMGSQGLTGVSYVEMIGGSPDAPPIWTAMPEPMIVAAHSASMQDLLASARGIISRAEETMTEVQSLVSENSGDITQAVKDVQSFTGALAQNSDKVAELIDQITSASAGVADATKRLQGIVERSEAVVTAVDPDKVRSTVDNISALTENLAAQRETIDAIVQRADQVAANVQSFSERLPELGAKADALIAAIEPERIGSTLDRLDAIAGAVDPAKVASTLDKIDSVMAAVDPAQVRTTIDNVARTTDALAARSEDIGAIVGRANTIAQNVEAFSQRLPALGDRADALAASIDPAKVSGTLDRIDTLTAAIDPERVRTTVEAVSGVAETLQTNRASIDAALARLGTVSGDVAAFTARLPGMGEKTDTLLAAIDPSKVAGSIDRIDAITAAVDPEQVRATVDAAGGVAASVQANRESIDATLARLGTVSGDVAAFTARLPAMGEKTDTLLAAIDPSKVSGSIDRIDAITAAVDPEQVRATVDAAGGVAASVQANRESIDATLARLGTVSNDVAAFAARLPAMGEKTDTLLAAIDPSKVSGSIDRIDAITAAVDPEQVRATVDAAANVAATIQAHRESIDATLTTLGSVSTDVAAFTARLPAMGEKAESLFAAVDSQKVAKALDDASQFVATLAAKRGDIDAIVADARAVSARFSAIGDRAESLLTKLDGMAGDGAGGILEDAKATLASIRAAADGFNAQVSTIGGGVGDFSGRGLRDFQNLVSEGQRTIGRLDRVISDLEQNPSGFLFGGETVPEYGSRRR